MEDGGSGLGPDCNLKGSRRCKSPAYSAICHYWLNTALYLTGRKQVGSSLGDQPAAALASCTMTLGAANRISAPAKASIT